ncbi:MAG TPA: non-canonical purine NTP pyrophosphatase [Pyrinomonadaceae bacterium]|nr:non-canonical purine NTP pyrophosphatase [Pyrinomonadaceae bacterium]
MVTGLLELLIATSNEGKAREITRAFSGLPLQIRSLKDFPSLHLVDEQGVTYEENAIAKAVGYAGQTGLYAIADDSGLEVDALDGRPGFLSARYGGAALSDVERNNKLLTSLAHIDVSERTARFVSVAVLAKPSEDTMPAARVLGIERGICEGKIALTQRGDHGFGYDSVFIPRGYNESFGELTDSIKDRISHRAQSILRIRALLKHLITQT